MAASFGKKAKHVGVGGKSYDAVTPKARCGCGHASKRGEFILKRIKRRYGIGLPPAGQRRVRDDL